MTLWGHKALSMAHCLLKCNESLNVYYWVLQSTKNGIFSGSVRGLVWHLTGNSLPDIYTETEEHMFQRELG